MYSAAQQDGQDCLHVYDLDQRTLLSVPKFQISVALPDLVREGFSRKLSIFGIF